MLLTTHYLEEADALADRIVLIGRGRIVAEGTPAEIKARVVGRKVRCRTALPLAEVAALPGVRDARREGELTELFAGEAERAVLELLAATPRSPPSRCGEPIWRKRSSPSTRSADPRGGGGMSAQTTVQPALAPSAAASARIYALEAKYEFLKQLRLPAYVVPTLAFPLVFYLLFGVALHARPGGPFDIPTYMIATYGAFGVMNAALFGFGVGVAIERGQGWMLFKRATPDAAARPLRGKLAMCLLFGLIMVGRALHPRRHGRRRAAAAATWLSLAGVQILGDPPVRRLRPRRRLLGGAQLGAGDHQHHLAARRLRLRHVDPHPDAAAVVKKVARFLPPYHYAQLALRTLGLDRGESVRHGRRRPGRLHASSRWARLDRLPAGRRQDVRVGPHLWHLYRKEEEYLPCACASSPTTPRRAERAIPKSPTRPQAPWPWRCGGRCWRARHPPSSRKPSWMR